MLRHSIDAGVPLTKVFRQQAERGSAAVQPLAGRVAARLERGDNLEDALRDERAVLPPLFLALVAVGEQTGRLPEVFEELQNYYQLQQKLTRHFRRRRLGRC